MRRVVAELLAQTGLGVIGSRSAEEIARRFVEKAAVAEGIGERAGETLSAFLAIAGPPAKAVDEIEALSRMAKLDIRKAVDRLKKRAFPSSPRSWRHW